jgi:hypothetical protein
LRGLVFEGQNSIPAWITHQFSREYLKQGCKSQLYCRITGIAMPFYLRAMEQQESIPVLFLKYSAGNFNVNWSASQ